MTKILLGFLSFKIIDLSELIFFVLILLTPHDAGFTVEKKWQNAKGTTIVVPYFFRNDSLQ